MNVKTWDLLDRVTGDVLIAGDLRGNGPDDWRWANGYRASNVGTHEVAWCRETGEVVYL